MRKWIPAALILVAALASALVWSRIPAQISPDFSQLSPVAVDGEVMTRWAVATSLPSAALVMWLLFMVLRTSAATRFRKALFGRWVKAEVLETGAFDRFSGTYFLIVTFLVGVAVAAHLLLLAIAIGGPSWLVRGFALLGGIALVLLGNFMPRVRPNPIMGVRLPRTMNDPILWARTHRLFGSLWVASGVLTIVLTPIAPRYALTAGFIAAAVSMIITFVFTMTANSRSRPRGTALALGLLIACATEASGQAKPRPDSIPPAGVIEDSVKFASGTLTLHGTLAMPARTNGPVPIAVLVAGSGPTDRNGNGPLAQTNTYRQLAWALAQRGIASIRYDKRGLRNMMEINHAEVVIEDFAQDVANAAAHVSNDRRFGKIFLVGHSEGAQLVLQAANRGAKADGIVMLSGMGRPLATVLHDQFALQIDPAKLTEVDSAFQKFLRGEDYGDVPALARTVFIPIYRKMLSSMAKYDPTAEIRRARKPILIVTGDMDLQTTVVDFEQLRAARPDATAILIPNTNHVFKRVSTRELAVQMPMYQDASLPIVPELSRVVSDWILAR